MSRYSGPKARVNRRLGIKVFESHGAIKATDRRDNPPGMHARPRRTSNYGTALAEKQKIKYHYGLGERQLRRYFDKVRHKAGNTGEQLLLMCERRLDNVLRRAGVVKTRPQARQGVVHGHFCVNGQKVTRPSYQLKAGDVITVRNNEKIQQLYQFTSSQSATEPCDWLSFDPETLRATMQGVPGPSDISLPVEVNIVIEFMSR